MLPWTFMNKSFCGQIFLLSKYQGEISELYTRCIFNIVKICQTVPKWLYHFAPAAMYKGSSCPLSSLTLAIFSLVGGRRQRLLGILDAAYRSMSCKIFHCSFPAQSQVVEALGLSCSMACRNLVPQTGTEPTFPALTGQILNHWTAKEVPIISLFHLNRFNGHEVDSPCVFNLHLMLLIWASFSCLFTICLSSWWSSCSNLLPSFSELFYLESVCYILLLQTFSQIHVLQIFFQLCLIFFIFLTISSEE